MNSMPMRAAWAMLWASFAVAQEREPVEQQLVRLMSDLRIEARAAGAVDALVALGSAAVPVLASSLEVLPGDGLDNQAWKAGVLTALERLGPVAREAGPDLLVAAFRLPVTLSDQAFVALRAVGPAAHVRFKVETASSGTTLLLNGLAIPGSTDPATVTKTVRTAVQTGQVLRAGARELEEVQQWLAKGSREAPAADEVARWTPLLQDMTRQALVACLLLPGLKLEGDGFPAARALVQLQGDLPSAEAAHALLLVKGRPAEQVTAAAALAHYPVGSRHTARALLAALQNADPRVVREAITALGMAGELAVPAVAALKQLSTHHDPQIAMRAQAALRAISR